MEEWRDVVNYEGLYQVSDMGRVKSVERWVKGSNGVTCPVKERILKNREGEHGRLAVTLWRNNKGKNKRVHTLVLEAFDGPRPEGMEGCHWDGNASNNKLSNLRWDTHQHNIDDMKRHGTLYKLPKFSNDDHPMAKLSNSDVLSIKQMLYETEISCVDIAKKFNTSSSRICSINKGKSWSKLPYKKDEKFPIRLYNGNSTSFTVNY